MNALYDQHRAHLERSARLWGTRRPGANLPRTGTTVFRGQTRPAVDFAYATQLVCEDRCVSADQIINSHYCAAIAARHMLWTVLFDGGHSMAAISRMFGADHATVRLGIISFRAFQQGASVA